MLARGQVRTGRWAAPAYTPCISILVTPYRSFGVDGCQGRSRGRCPLGPSGGTELTDPARQNSGFALVHLNRARSGGAGSRSRFAVDPHRGAERPLQVVGAVDCRLVPLAP